MSAKRKWGPILAGVAIVLACIAIVSIAVSITWMREHLEVGQASQAEASRAFDEAQERFRGLPPLLEMRDGVPRYNADRATREPSSTRLSMLHILAFDPKEGRLARFELPFWFLRLKSAPIKFSAYASGFDDAGVRLTVEDLERHGPGVVLDLEPPRGGRVLVWAE